MSYTHQTVVWEHCSSAVNTYGDVTRTTSNILARKQPKRTVVKTTDGREFISKTIYYVDPNVTPSATSITKLDKMDGEVVVDVYIMCGLLNKPKMVRVVTV